MAAAIPTLDGLPYGVASRIPYYVGGRQSYSVYHGTAEAELLVQFLSKDISLSANNLAGTHLVVSDDGSTGGKKSTSVFRMHIAYSQGGEDDMHQI